MGIKFPQYLVPHWHSCSPSNASEELIFIELYGAQTYVVD